MKNNRCHSRKPNGFTLLEMMIVMMVIALLLLLTLPNIQQKQKVLRAKTCSSLIEVINSQVLLYEVDHGNVPSSLSDLVSEGYIKESQTACPDGTPVVLTNGEASNAGS